MDTLALEAKAVETSMTRCLRRSSRRLNLLNLLYIDNGFFVRFALMTTNLKPFSNLKKAIRVVNLI